MKNTDIKEIKVINIMDRVEKSYYWVYYLAKLSIFIVYLI